MTAAVDGVVIGRRRPSRLGRQSFGCPSGDVVEQVLLGVRIGIFRPAQLAGRKAVVCSFDVNQIPILGDRMLVDLFGVADKQISRHSGD